MRPEQVPGTLFVLLCALAAWAIQAPEALLGLALGCAVGWWMMIEDHASRQSACFFLALAAWAASFLYLAWKVLV